MQLAINYSLPACDLLKDGKATFDVFKCASDWPDTIAPAQARRPVYLHFPFHAGGYGPTVADWDDVGRQIEATHTPFVNTHLVPLAQKFPHIPCDTASHAHENEVVDSLLRDILPLIERFGADRVIVENAPWNPAYPESSRFLRLGVEPAVISRVVRETGCGYLLDIGHARCTSLSMGIDVRDYMAALPVDRICEVHLSGLKLDSGGVWVDHYGLNAEDWIAVGWAFDRIRAGEWSHPWVASWEYGGLGPLYEDRNDIAIMAEQLPRLFELTQSCSSR